MYFLVIEGNLLSWYGIFVSERKLVRLLPCPCFGVVEGKAVLGLLEV